MCIQQYMCKRESDRWKGARDRQARMYVCTVSREREIQRRGQSWPPTERYGRASKEHMYIVTTHSLVCMDEQVGISSNSRKEPSIPLHDGSPLCNPIITRYRPSHPRWAREVTMKSSDKVDTLPVDGVLGMEMGQSVIIRVAVGGRSARSTRGRATINLVWS